MRVSRFTRVAVALIAISCGRSSAPAAVLDDVPASELAGYQIVYDWDIPDNSGGWNTTAVPYTVNNAASIAAGSYDRVAYYLQLDNNWVYASFSATNFLTDPTKLGVPGRNTTNGTNVVSNMTVQNMNVFSNVTGITTGSGLTGGKLEFWGSNYATGANSVFDHDDDGFGTSSGHGSMQIHNTSAPQTLFGYSAWGAVRDSELGIGNSTGAHPDWTFNTGNNNLYSVQRMQILVHVPEPAAAGLLALAVPLLARRRRM